MALYNQRRWCKPPRLPPPARPRRRRNSPAVLEGPVLSGGTFLEPARGLGFSETNRGIAWQEEKRSNSWSEANRGNAWQEEKRNNSWSEPLR